MKTSVGSFSPSMTTNESTFIEQAKDAGQLYIEQPYELYSEKNHEAWRKLYARMLPRWDRYANEHFLKASIRCAWIRIASRTSKM